MLADDHAILRDALADRLSREPGFEVIDAVSNAEDAVELALRHKPQILVLDIDMPGLDCFDAAQQIGSLVPEIRIVFLSAHLHDHYIEIALRLGAAGYLTKQETPEQLMSMLKLVAQGGSCFSKEVQQRIVLDSNGPRILDHPESLLSTLTGRELEVLRYVAHGLAKKEIARTMKISVKTVDRHTTNLMNKLDIHDRVALARFAIREGLVQA